MIPEIFKGYVAHNRFRITEWIGSGPHGEVFRVEEKRADHQARSWVAKFYIFSTNRHLPDLERYREAVNLTDFRNVIRVEAVDQREANGVGYYCQVMEHPLGGNLTHLLSLSPSGLPHEPVSGDILRSLLLKLAEAVNQIHDSPVQPNFHGNLKPNNIFFSAAGEILLADLQLAGFNHNQPPENNTLAPVFSAPEQLRDDASTQPGPGADIWSMGIMMYQLATGEAPFSGATYEEMKLNITASVNNHKKVEHIHPPIRRIIDRCLAKSPVNRYTSVQELITDLGNCPFTKKCDHGHENQYFAKECREPDCGSKFLDSQHDDLVVYNIPWARHTPLPITLSPDEQRLFQVDLFPDQHPEYSLFRLTGKSVTIKFGAGGHEDQPLEKLVVEIQPPPKFVISPSVFNLNWSPSMGIEEIAFQVGCTRSEAIIEKAILYMDNQEVKQLHWGEDGAEIRRGKRINMKALVDLSESQKDSVHQLRLYLYMKNREHSVQLESRNLEKPFNINIMDVPVPYLEVSQPIVVYCGTGPTTFPLVVQNIGGGSFSITNITARVANRTQLDMDDNRFIDFQLPIQPIVVEHDKSRYVNYVVHPEDANESLVEVNIHLYYDYLRDGQTIKNELKQGIKFKIEHIETGDLVAVDFGTTSTCCMRLPDIMKEEETPQNVTPVDHDRMIASALSYPANQDKIVIGKKAEADFRAGEPNAFRSFKRFLANRSKLYDLFYDQAPGKSLTADELITDYISEIFKKIRIEYGYNFKNYVFTHPSKFSLNQHAALRKIILSCNIDLENCLFIDEATAGALPFITLNEGEYRLVVYDFGGGTIDITYLHVTYTPDFNKAKIEVLDTGGLPHFGGDDVTKALIDIYLEKIKEELQQKKWALLLPSDTERDPRLRQNENKNMQKIVSICDSFKTQELFHPDFNLGHFDQDMQSMPQRLTSREMELFVRDAVSNKIRSVKIDLAPEIKPCDVYRVIYKQIENSIGMITQMMKREVAREKEKLSTYILLTGRSSKLPIVQKMFEAYRENQRPYWDTEHQKLLFKEKSEKNGNLNYDQLYFADELADFNLINPMKECVVLGSLIFGLHMIDPSTSITLDIYARHEKTCSRIGMFKSNKILIPGISKGRVFEEWIPKGKWLVPLTGIPEHANKYDYAIAERSYIFHFDRRTKTLMSPILLYEHHSWDNEADFARCSVLGEWDIAMPSALTKVKTSGRLTIELTTELVIRVYALIENERIEAYKSQ